MTDSDRQQNQIDALQTEVLALWERLVELEGKVARAQGGVEQGLEPPFGEVFRDKQ